VHALLGNILHIVPMSYKQIESITSAKYPFHALAQSEQFSYLHNVLTLATTHMQLRYQLLKLVINKLLKLDLLSPRDEVNAAQARCEEEDQFPMNLEEVGAVEPDCMAHETRTNWIYCWTWCWCT